MGGIFDQLVRMLGKILKDIGTELRNFFANEFVNFRLEVKIAIILVLIIIVAIIIF